MHNLHTAVLPSLLQQKKISDLNKTERKSTTDSRKLNFNGGIHSAVCLMCFWTAEEQHTVNLCQSLQYEAFHQGLESCV